MDDTGLELSLDGIDATDGYIDTCGQAMVPQTGRTAVDGAQTGALDADKRPADELEATHYANLIAAILAIERLPLSEEEKAEIVRCLMKDRVLQPLDTLRVLAVKRDSNVDR